MVQNERVVWKHITPDDDLQVGKHGAQVLQSPNVEHQKKSPDLTQRWEWNTLEVFGGGFRHEGDL